MLTIDTPEPIQNWLLAETVNTTQSKMSLELNTYFRVIFPEQKRGQGDQTQFAGNDDEKLFQMLRSRVVHISWALYGKQKVPFVKIYEFNKLQRILLLLRKIELPK